MNRREFITFIGGAAQQPTKFELVINLKTADEVIE